MFAAILIGIAIYHRYAFAIAVGGVGAIALYKVLFTGFKTGAGFAGLATHFGHEAVLLANLLFLLTGFAILARHFEESQIPFVMPNLLPDN